MCNVRLENGISAEELRTRLKWKSMRECLQDRMQWFGHLEGMEESAWSCKCRIFKASGTFHRRRPRKTWKIIISDLKEKSKSARTWMKTEMLGSLIRIHPTHASMANRR